jgi:hypothetical protein
MPITVIRSIQTFVANKHSEHSALLASFTMFMKCSTVDYILLDTRIPLGAFSIVVKAPKDVALSWAYVLSSWDCQ